MHQKQIPSSDARPTPPNRRVPVISVPVDALEHHPGWRTDLLAALRDLVGQPKAPNSLTIWAREDIGRDGFNQPTHLLFLYVVMPRGGAGTARLLGDALDQRWGVSCRHEGSYDFVGGERPLAGIEDGEVVTHD